MHYVMLCGLPLEDSAGREVEWKFGSGSEHKPQKSCVKVEGPGG